MARPKAEAPPAKAILALVDEQGRLALRVTPGTRVELLEIVDGRLCAKVRARPQDGEATAAALSLVAGALGIARGRVTLLRGATSREKLIRID